MTQQYKAIHTSCSQMKIRSLKHCLELNKVAGSATCKQSGRYEIVISFKV